MKNAQIIGALQLFLLLAALDQTIITTAMPRIIEQLSGFDRYSWATTSYLFSSTVAVPVSGKLSDLYGRKNSLLIGVFIFVLASIACGSAYSLPGFPIDGMNQLIIYRILQGIGGGAIVSLCFSVVGDLFAPAERGRYQGYFAAVFALASIIGPALGGYIADVASWRWLFFINLPIGAIGSILFYLKFKEPKRETATEAFDWRGLVLFCVTATCLLFVVSLPSQQAPLLVNISLVGMFAILLALFLRLEIAHPNPFLPVRLIRNKIILISIISLAVYGIGMFGAGLLVPLFMQSIRGMSVSHSGIVLSPLILIVAIASIAGGQWMSRSGKYKAIVLTGLSLMTAGVFVLAWLPLDAQLPILISTMAVVGLGIGILLPVYTVVIQNAVSDDLIGTVTGLSQFFRSIGGTLGVACLGSLLIFFYNANLQKHLDPTLPPSVVAALHNPLEPGKLRKALTESLPAIPAAKDTLVEATVKEVAAALYSSIQIIYWMYGAALAAAVVLNLFLEELPLRSSKTATSQETLSPSQKS